MKARSAKKPAKKRRPRELSPEEDARLIKEENRKPTAGMLWLIAGRERGDAIYGVRYHDRYLGYTWYSEWRGRLGYAKAANKVITGFPSRAAAVAAAKKQLERRMKQGWVRISVPGLVALYALLKRR